MIQVLRPESEVFSPETISSFEGMPVTNDHPPDGVTVDNIRSLQKGHAHNVRRGSGDESDLLLADLIITDPALIDAILSGKREISCGYTYELHEENGQYIQRKIRGNHVAVVDADRAGPRVSIRDREPSGIRSRSISNHERSQPIMKKSLLRKLACMAKDGDPEAVEALAEAVERITDPETAETVIAVTGGPEPEAVPENPAPEEAPSAADGSDALAAILDRLDQLIALLTPAAPAADQDPGSGEELPEELAEIIEETLEAIEPEPSASPDPGDMPDPGEETPDPSVSTVIEPDENEDPARDCGAASRETADALRAALSAIRPELKRMSRSERLSACRRMAARLSRDRAADTAYAALTAPKRSAPADGKDLGRRIMQKRNPNYRQ